MEKTNVEKELRKFHELNKKKGYKPLILDGVTKVKIICHCCDGKGRITEKEYPSREEITVICPECNGDGWVWSEK